jgi:hypothetical protein
LPELREGYPWIASSRRTYCWPSGRLRSVAGIGVHWQSVIVTPHRPAWASPAPVGDDPHFAWWKRLRDVECSWISSRGQDERFLYYDGPILRPAPLAVSLHDQRLRIEQGPLPTDPGHAVPVTGRRGLYVKTTAAGVATQWIGDVGRLNSVELSGLGPRPAADVEREFTDALVRVGLLRTEADGMVACWREAFFRRAGRRFLLFMTQSDYDYACPLTIRPTPTETVRVGIVWTEFDP